jgi:hypothetical protein
MRRLILLLLSLVCFQLYAQNRWALLIGISEYTPEEEETDYSWNNIHGENDVRLLAPTLTKQGFSIDSLLSADATARNIRSRMKELVRKVRQGDIVFIHFSGHGQPVEDRKPFDEKDGWDEAIIPVDAKMRYAKGVYEGVNHILDDKLNVFFESLRKKAGKTGYVYAIMDACHAGTSYRGLNDTIYTRGTNYGFSSSGKYFKAPKADSNAIYHYRLKGTEDKADIFILEACRAYEQNTEIRRKGEYYGPLSYYVNAALQNEDIENTEAWVASVRESYTSDIAVKNKQHLVIESSSYKSE